MALKVYNTLTRKKEEFSPLKKGEVKMYVCGVTVYDDCHLGHARAYVAFDIIYRYLEHKGYKVNYIQNFTDVDDKIINRAKSELRSVHSLQSTPKDPAGQAYGTSKPTGQAVHSKKTSLKEKVKEISERYIKVYFEMMDKLNVKRAIKYPKATENISDMIKMIKGLKELGYAYEAGGNVYFQVDKFRRYGRLSRRPHDEMVNISRIEKDEYKKNPLDFALWKKAKPEEPSWSSPWGEGRPGWHIECSVMSQKFLGESLDIHGGGSDLIFPHHENEIAQSEAYTGKPFVRYWLHNGFVTINKEKMSKSLGNIFTLKELFQKYPPEVARLFLISTHYRSPIDFSLDRLEEARRRWERICICLEKRPKKFPKKRIAHPKVKIFISRFANCLDDDFNTAGALGVVFELVGLINKEFEMVRQGLRLSSVECPHHPELSRRKDKPDPKLIKAGYQGLKEMLEILGLSTQVERKADKKIEGLIKKREAARQAKDWTLADKIREALKKQGVILEDTKEGTKWRRI